MNQTDGPAISPDGRYIAYSAGSGGWAGNTMYLHDRETGEARPLEGAEHGLFPFWSPDGHRLGFFVLVGPHFALRVLDLERGTVRTVGGAPFLGMAMAATWTTDGRIIHTGRDLALHEISLEACEVGGEDAAVGAGGGHCPSRVLARPDTAAGEIGLLAPQLLADGRGLVYAVAHDDGSSRIVVRTDLPQRRSGPSEARTLLEWSDGTPYFLALSPGGRLLFNAAAGLWAVPLSPDARSATGEPGLVRERGYRPTVSRDGTLAYRIVPERDHQRLLLVDRAGNVIRQIGPGAERILHPVFSPDGRRVAVYPAVAGNWDIRVYDVETGAATRVTRDPRADFDMAWGPSDNELIFTTFRRDPSTLARAHVGDDEPPQPLDLEAANRSVFALWEPAVSPDGRWLAFYLVEDDGIDLWHEDLSDDSPSHPLIAGPGAEIHPAFSPDGRYLAYMHDDGGVYTVRVRRGPGERQADEWTVGAEGARYPKWSPAGDELFFVRRDTLFAVPVVTGDSFRVDGPAEPLFTGEAVGTLLNGVNRNNPTYDIAADAGDGAGAGARFAVVANRAGEGRARIVVERPGG